MLTYSLSANSGIFSTNSGILNSDVFTHLRLILAVFVRVTDTEFYPIASLLGTAYANLTC
jgi:hypothetical protein